MTDYSEQIARIQAKLPKAKQADKDLEVFGASSHQYKLNPPATLEEVLAFEQKFNVTLPDCYRVFLLQIGNGGAAPYYGLFPLGYRVDELAEPPEQALSMQCCWFPKMSDEMWEMLNQPIEDETSSDEVLEQAWREMFGGILPIGQHGCTWCHGLILNGIYSGRVVYLDLQRHKPKFAFENNFLDWYEHWLDEVIAGELTGESRRGFGIYKGGTEETLLVEFLASADFEDKEDCLIGLLHKKNLKVATLEQLLNLIEDYPAHLDTLTKITSKFDYPRTEPKKWFEFWK